MEIMLNHFTYNSKSTADFGLLVTGRTIFGAPSRKVERYSVAGRNGDIIVDLGAFENYQVQYEIAVIDSFKTNARAIANWLLSTKGYNRLEDTYDTTHFRLAALYSNIEYAVTALDREGTAVIVFDCKPQRFLNAGETTTTITSASYTLNNPTNMPARPLLRVTTTGKVTINGNEITVSAVDGYVDIDCETQQAYKGTTNCNNDIIVDEFPVLVGGNNTITQTTTTVAVTPRWWEL